MNISELITRTLNGSTFRVRRYVHVPLRRGRDKNGRFNGKNRKAYSYPIYDKSKPVTYRKLMAENITANNALLAKLKY